MVYFHSWWLDFFFKPNLYTFAVPVADGMYGHMKPNCGCVAPSSGVILRWNAVLNAYDTRSAL